MWSRSSWPGSRRPPGAEGGPRARGERSDLERLPPPLHCSRSLLSDAPRPRGQSRPERCPPPARATGRSRRCAHGTGLQAPRFPLLAPHPPAPRTHGPLPRRYLAIPGRQPGRLGRRPGAAQSPQSPGAGGAEEGGRAQPAASAAAVSPPLSQRWASPGRHRREAARCPPRASGAAAARAARRQQ